MQRRPDKASSGRKPVRWCPWTPDDMTSVVGGGVAAYSFDAITQLFKFTSKRTAASNTGDVWSVILPKTQVSGRTSESPLGAANPTW